MRIIIHLLMPAMLACIVQLPANQCHAQTEDAILHVNILDEESHIITPARIHISSSDGKTAGLPPEAIGVMYGRNDRPEGYGYQPDSSFYVNGQFSLNLRPGDYTLTLSKGMEYLDQAYLGQTTDHIICGTW